jgi:uncharacterized protein (TIGR03067 family)
MSPLLFAVSLVIGAPALKEIPGPEPTLIGEWIPESVTVNGRPVRPGSDQWVFRADRTWDMWARGVPVGGGSFAWDPKGSPGTVDLTSTVNSGPADLCRFRVDGDTLTLSVGHDSTVRPAGLEPGKKATVWVFKRLGKEH